VGIEIIRDQMTPLVRELSHRARAVHMTGRPAEAARAIAYDIATLHVAVGQFMAAMPNADGFALLMTNMQMIAERYGHLSQSMPSVNEH
jgi:hypothetical protein